MMSCFGSICDISCPSSFCDTSVFHDASVSCSDFGFAIFLRTLPDSLEEARKRQQYHFQQTAAASCNMEIAKLKKQIAELQA